MGGTGSLGGYSPNLVEGVFSEVRRSKLSVERSEKHHKTAWRNSFADEKRRLSSIRSGIMYQAVATRNGATSGEFLHLRTGAQA